MNSATPLIKFAVSSLIGSALAAFSFAVLMHIQEVSWLRSNAGELIEGALIWSGIYTAFSVYVHTERAPSFWSCFLTALYINGALLAAKLLMVGLPLATADYFPALWSRLASMETVYSIDRVLFLSLFMGGGAYAAFAGSKRI